MQSNNQKKSLFSINPPQSQPPFPVEDLQDLKSEFFETFQKNDLKLLSNGLEEFPEPEPPQPPKRHIIRPLFKERESGRFIGSNTCFLTGANKFEENPIAPQSFKPGGYYSNPFPKVIPESASNFFTDECTQLSLNNYKNRQEELLSTYWGNSFEGESPKNNMKIFQLEKEREERQKFMLPNKPTFNPDVPSFFFSTPPNIKMKPRDLESEPIFERIGGSLTMNIGGYKQKNNTNFSEYFNSSKRTPSLSKEPYINDPRDFASYMKYEDYIGRSFKGLKFLTIKVRDIVQRKERTSYREVAEILIEVLNFYEKSQYKSELEFKKEITNVKRRAYDALTVLIACGVIDKQGKEIKINPKSSIFKNPKYTHEELMETKKIVQANVNEKLKVLEAKKNSFKELYLKFLSINNLIQRNISVLSQSFEQKPQKPMNPAFWEEDEHRNYEKLQDFQRKFTEFEDRSDIVRSYHQNKFIKFPFIVIELVDNAVALNINSDRTKLALNSKSELTIYGDVDILMKMDMHNKFQKSQSLLKLIPRDIHQYLPLEIVDQIR